MDTEEERLKIEQWVCLIWLGYNPVDWAWSEVGVEWFGKQRK